MSSVLVGTSYHFHSRLCKNHRVLPHSLNLSSNYLHPYQGIDHRPFHWLVRTTVVKTYLRQQLIFQIQNLALISFLFHLYSSPLAFLVRPFAQLYVFLVFVQSLSTHFPAFSSILQLSLGPSEKMKVLILDGEDLIYVRVCHQNSFLYSENFYHSLMANNILQFFSAWFQPYELLSPEHLHI